MATVGPELHSDVCIFSVNIFQFYQYVGFALRFVLTLYVFVYRVRSPHRYWRASRNKG